MQKGGPRKKAESQKKLAEIFKSALTIGKKTASERLKTAYSLKDNFQEHFVECTFKFQATLEGSVADRQVQMDQFQTSLPAVQSPIWHIKGVFSSFYLPFSMFFLMCSVQVLIHTWTRQSKSFTWFSSGSSSIFGGTRSTNKQRKEGRHSQQEYRHWT